MAWTWGRAPRPWVWWKLVAAIGLTALADQLFQGGAGAILGGFSLALLAASLATRRAQWADRRGRTALLVAVGFALSMVANPTFLGWTLFWSAAMIAALSCRAPDRDDAWRLARQLGWAALCVLITPVKDAVRLKKIRNRRSPSTGLKLLPLIAVPMSGGALFLGLFYLSNPVVAELIGQLRVPDIDIPRILFWLMILIGVWGLLRPGFRRWVSPKRPGGEASALPGLSLASVGLSLLVFNLLFAAQNGLDLAFLWQGARLPTGVTLADYAHRGAYTLIATALLAGLFVLVALRPGSAGARHPMIRRLVMLWVAQNLFLVSSCVLRTLDYIEAYSLTRLRIAALAWMGLVAFGLAAICWRLIHDKSAAWLINANAAATALVLTAFVLIDTGALAARWNVRNGREVSGSGAAIDVCYLQGLGDSGLVSLIELEQRPLPGDLRLRVQPVRVAALSSLQKRQANWRGWTALGAARLAIAERQLAGHIEARPSASEQRNCDGSLVNAPARS